MNTMSPTETVSSTTSVNPGYNINMTTPPNNYGDSTKLKEVRDNSHNIIYGIFIAPSSSLDISFNKGSSFSSASNFSNKNSVSFITCPQTNSVVGTDILSQTIASYDLKFSYDDNTNQSTTITTSTINVDGYTGTFPQNYSQNAGSGLIKLELQNDDPTGNTSSSISQLNQQFGGYYNIQKILTSTGIIGISTANTGDTADSGAAPHDTYDLILQQTIPASMTGSVQQYEKK